MGGHQRTDLARHDREDGDGGDGLNLIAGPNSSPTSLHSFWMGELISSKPELGLVENFVHMLGVPGADQAKLTKLLRTFYVLHMDHGGGNLSTFTEGCRVWTCRSVLKPRRRDGGTVRPLTAEPTKSAQLRETVGTTDPDEIEQRVRVRRPRAEKSSDSVTPCCVQRTPSHCTVRTWTRAVPR